MWQRVAARCHQITLQQSSTAFSITYKVHCLELLSWPALKLRFAMRNRTCFCLVSSSCIRRSIADNATSVWSKYCIRIKTTMNAEERTFDTSNHWETCWHGLPLRLLPYHAPPDFPATASLGSSAWVEHLAKCFGHGQAWWIHWTLRNNQSKQLVEQTPRHLQGRPTTPCFGCYDGDRMCKHNYSHYSIYPDLPSMPLLPLLHFQASSLVWIWDVMVTSLLCASRSRTALHCSADLGWGLLAVLGIVEACGWLQMITIEANIVPN